MLDPQDFGRFVAVFDERHRWVALTDELAAVLGYRARELLGRSAWLTSGRPLEERRRVEAQLAGDGAIAGVAPAVRRDGSRFQIRYSARVVNGGELYVSVAEPIAPGPVGELLEPARLQALGLRAEAARLQALDRHLESVWFTKAEAADYARVSVTTLERAVRAGGLRVGGTPGLRLFHRRWLDAWLAGGALVLVLALLLAGCQLGVGPARTVMS